MTNERFHPVYPGHPLVLAIQAMEHFEGPEAALAQTKDGWSKLVGSSAVSGAGDSAHNADRLLRLLHNRELLLTEAVSWSSETWKRQVGPGSGNHEDRYLPGVEQARELEGRFFEAARSWGWT